MDYSPLDQNLVVSQVSSTERAIFIKKTYMHVAMAVLGFIAFEALFQSIPAIKQIGMSMAQGWTWLIVLGGFAFATGAVERWAMTSKDRGKQYIALTIFVALYAFLFVPLIYIATQMAGAEMIMQAGVATLALFTGLSAVVLLTGKDFSFLRTGIMIGGFIAIGLIVAGVAFGFTLGWVFSAAMIILAAASILYQTSNILHRYGTEQYVAASLGLTGSLLMMFWYVLQLIMSFSGD